MVVRCSSHGGFPKPEIRGFLNDERVVLNTTWESESSLSPYNVTGTLWLNMTKDSNFTCFVEYDGLLRSTSLLLAKANDCIVSTALPSYNVITASSIIIITFVLAVTLAVKYLPRHACSHCSKNQVSAEDDVKESMNPPHSCKLTCEMSSLWPDHFCRFPILCILHCSPHRSLQQCLLRWPSGSLKGGESSRKIFSRRLTT